MRHQHARRPARETPLHRALRRSAFGAVAFYNTGLFRREQGYARPHDLTRELAELRQQGYVVFHGEGSGRSTYRSAHAHRGDHHWQPDMVIIVPREMFDDTRARWTADRPGSARRALPVDTFARHEQVTWLNGERDPTNGRARVRGEYAASQRARR